MHKFRSQKELDEWVKYVLGQSTFTDEDRDNFIHECVQDYHDNILMEKLEGVFGNNTGNMNNPNKPLFSFVPQNKTTGYAANMDNILPLSKPEQKVLDDNSEFDTKSFLNNQKPIKQTYIEPSYKNTPTIYNSPNAPEIKAAPKTMESKYSKLGAFSALQKALSKSPIGTLEQQYYGIATHDADGEKPSKKMQLENEITRIGDIENPQIKEKYTKQAEKMYKSQNVSDADMQDKIKYTPLVKAKEDSELHDVLKNSEGMKEWIKDNYQKVQNNEKYKETVNFQPGLLDGKQRAAWGTVHFGDIDAKANKDGSIDVEIKDGHDYNKQQGYSIANMINNNAYEQQQKGKLQNYILSVPINYSKNEINGLLNSNKQSEFEQLIEIFKKMKKYR